MANASGVGIGKDWECPSCSVIFYRDKGTKVKVLKWIWLADDSKKPYRKWTEGQKESKNAENKSNGVSKSQVEEMSIAYYHHSYIKKFGDMMNFDIALDIKNI